MLVSTVAQCVHSTRITFQSVAPWRLPGSPLRQLSGGAGRRPRGRRERCCVGARLLPGTTPRPLPSRPAGCSGGKAPSSPNHSQGTQALLWAGRRRTRSEARGTPRGSPHPRASDAAQSTFVFLSAEESKGEATPTSARPGAGDARGLRVWVLPLSCSVPPRLRASARLATI